MQGPCNYHNKQFYHLLGNQYCGLCCFSISVVLITLTTVLRSASINPCSAGRGLRRPGRPGKPALVPAGQGPAFDSWPESTKAFISRQGILRLMELFKGIFFSLLLFFLFFPSFLSFFLELMYKTIVLLGFKCDSGI